MSRRLSSGRVSISTDATLNFFDRRDGVEWKS